MKAYMANNMDPDQTALSGAVWSVFIVFASMIKSSQKGIRVYAADEKKQMTFQDKNYWWGKG